jgi:hypothetical protein
MPVYFVNDVVPGPADPLAVYRFQIGDLTFPLLTEEGRGFGLADVRGHFDAHRERGTPLVHVYLASWDRQKQSVYRLILAIRTLREAAVASQMQHKVRVFVWEGN